MHVIFDKHKQNKTQTEQKRHVVVRICCYICLWCRKNVSFLQRKWSMIFIRFPTDGQAQCKRFNPGAFFLSLLFSFAVTQMVKQEVSRSADENVEHRMQKK